MSPINLKRYAALCQRKHRRICKILWIENVTEPKVPPELVACLEVSCYTRKGRLKQKSYWVLHRELKINDVIPVFDKKYRLK